MEKMFLTNGGNLLRHFETSLIGTNGVGAKRFYFQKPNGEFIREVSSEEAEYLSQNCLEIEVNNPSKHPEFLPTWYFIKSILVLNNYSNFKWETSNNGGNYSFHTYHDWYVAKYPDGSWKFAYIERHATSAEFSYCELAGRFETSISVLNLTNVVTGRIGMYATKFGGEEVLERIATMSSFEDMWNEEYEYIPSRWDEEEGGYVGKALSFSDKKQIVTRLKELGVEKTKKKSPRGNRGGRR